MHERNKKNGTANIFSGRSSGIFRAFICSVRMVSRQLWRCVQKCTGVEKEIVALKNDIATLEHQMALQKKNVRFTKKKLRVSNCKWPMRMRKFISYKEY